MIFHLAAAFRQIWHTIRIKLVHGQLSVLHHAGKWSLVVRKKEKLLFVVAHVVPEGADKSYHLQRLKECLDGILCSFDGYDKDIFLLTKPGYSLRENLPAYLISVTQEYFSNQEDPMLVEFDSYDLFHSNMQSYDYFFFLEDDIIIHDALWVHKIEFFNKEINDPSILLFPHRYEYDNGVKFYNDQIMHSKMESNRYRYADWSTIKVGGIEFCKFENPHAAIHCLNREQVEYWTKKGNPLRNVVTAFGTLESAATFNLCHAFTIYKPHPDNLGYLEVRHFGNKYLKQYGVLKS